MRTATVTRSPETQFRIRNSAGRRGDCRRTMTFHQVLSGSLEDNMKLYFDDLFREDGITKEAAWKMKQLS